MAHQQVKVIPQRNHKRPLTKSQNHRLRVQPAKVGPVVQAVALTTRVVVQQVQALLRVRAAQALLPPRALKKALPREQVLKADREVVRVQQAAELLIMKEAPAELAQEQVPAAQARALPLKKAAQVPAAQVL